MVNLQRIDLLVYGIVLLRNSNLRVLAHKVANEIIMNEEGDNTVIDVKILPQRVNAFSDEYRVAVFYRVNISTCDPILLPLMT